MTRLIPEFPTILCESSSCEWKVCRRKTRASACVPQESLFYPKDGLSYASLLCQDCREIIAVEVVASSTADVDDIGKVFLCIE